MIKTILIVILAVAFLGLAPSGISQTPASSKDEKAIRSLILERIESFNNKHEAPQPHSLMKRARIRNELWYRFRRNSYEAQALYCSLGFRCAGSTRS